MIGSIPDNEQLPAETWKQLRGLAKSGHDAHAIAAKTGVSIARAERLRAELTFTPPKARKTWKGRR